MNTMIVYFMMLKPAVLSALLVVGVPLAIGAWLLPYLRERKRREGSPPSHPNRARMAQMIGMGP